MNEAKTKVKNTEHDISPNHKNGTDNFCSKCGARLVEEPNNHATYRTCQSCGHVRYQEAKVAVTTAIYSHDKLLLVKRRYPPEKDKWSLPGGYLNPHEAPALAAARETLEETGLIIDNCKLLDVLYNPEQGGADITIVYLGVRSGGQLKAGDDAADADFFQIDGLPELAFSSTRHIVETLQRSILENRQEPGFGGGNCELQNK